MKNPKVLEKMLLDIKAIMFEDRCGDIRSLNNRYKVKIRERFLQALDEGLDWDLMNISNCLIFEYEGRNYWTHFNWDLEKINAELEKLGHTIDENENVYALPEFVYDMTDDLEKASKFIETMKNEYKGISPMNLPHRYVITAINDIFGQKIYVYSFYEYGDEEKYTKKYTGINVPHETTVVDFMEEYRLLFEKEGYKASCLVQDDYAICMIEEKDIKDYHHRHDYYYVWDDLYNFRKEYYTVNK